MISESSGSLGREGGRKGEEESGGGERGREEGEQGLQARMYVKALPYSSPNIPAIEYAPSVPVPRILFILFSQPQVAPFVPLNLLIPTFPSVGHCASNAEHRPRQQQVLNE